MIACVTKMPITDHRSVKLPWLLLQSWWQPVDSTGILHQVLKDPSDPNTREKCPK